MSRVRVKICGITRVEDLLAATAAGADAIGLVFYESSPRHLSIPRARELLKHLPPFVSRVALFVNPDPDYVRKVLSEVAVDLLQFHGDETDDACAVYGRPYIKAIRVSEDTDIALEVSRYPNASAVLLDTYTAHSRGGTGETFDWTRIPRRLTKPLILAGGLTQDNVAAAVQEVRPFAVDVSSGVELEKGKKSAEKIVAFINAMDNPSA